MSKLAVGSLEGLASEGYKISVASGSKFVQTGASLQVVQTIKTNTFSTNSTSFVDVTDLSATITPSSTSSKVLVMAQICYCRSNTGGFFKVVGGNTATYVGDTATSAVRAVFGGYDTGGDSTTHSGVIMYVDSPNTTSATTYKVQAQRAITSTTQLFVNRDTTAFEDGNHIRGASSIILMEIAG